MKELAYFQLKSPEHLGDFLSFMHDTLVPVFKRAGCQQMSLYRATGDALSPYRLELEFESDEARRAAMHMEGTSEATQRFLEFTREVSLVTYEEILVPKRISSTPAPSVVYSRHLSRIPTSLLLQGFGRYT